MHVAAVVLGVLGLLGGLGGNSIVLLLGLGAIGLGLGGWAPERRRLATWGVVCGALSVLGYVGLLAQRAQNL
jgi:hypothetical protein